MKSRRIQLLLVTDSEEQRKGLPGCLSWDRDLVELTTYAATRESLSSLKFPFGHATFDFVFLIITTGSPDLFLQHAYDYVVSSNRVLLVSSDQPSSASNNSALLANWRFADLGWKDAISNKLYEEALRKELRGPSVIDSIRRLYRRIVLRKGIAGLVLLITSALTTGVGYIHQIQEIGSRYIPHQFCEAGETILNIFTFAMSGAGAILVAIHLVFEKLAKTKTRIGIAGSWCLASVLVLMVLFLQSRLNRPAPKHTDSALALVQDFVSRLWSSESAASNGGIEEILPQPNQETPPVQAWVTAQSIVGIITAITNLDVTVKSGLTRNLMWIDSVALDTWQITANSNVLALLVTNGLSAGAHPPFSFYDGNQMLKWLASNGASNLPPSIVSELDGDCRIHGGGGWGYFGGWQPAITEIEAWVTIAKIKCLSKGVFLDDKEANKVRDSVALHLASIRQREIHKENGVIAGVSPVPLPTNFRGIEKLARTYSELMALWAHIEALGCSEVPLDAHDRSVATNFVTEEIELLLAQAPSETTLWVPNPTRFPQNEKFFGLSGQVLHVMHRARVLGLFPEADVHQQALARLQSAFVEALDRSSIRAIAVDDNKRTHDADRYLLPANQTVEGSTFLWYPWTLLSLGEIEDDAYLKSNHPKTAETARVLFSVLGDRFPDMRLFGLREFNYVAAESLYCVGTAWPQIAQLDGSTK